MMHRTTASSTLACEGCGAVINVNEPVWGAGGIIACTQDCARLAKGERNLADLIKAIEDLRVVTAGGIPAP